MELIVTPGQLRKHIRRRKLNGRELAQLASTSQPTISRLASGKQKKCRGDLGLRIEAALGVEPGSLFGEKPPPSMPAPAEAAVSASNDAVVPTVATESSISENQGAAA